MATDSTKAALRATLHALAPAMRIRPADIPKLTERLINVGVGVDSTGALAMSAGSHAGRDVSEFIRDVVRRSEPGLFTDFADNPSPPHPSAPTTPPRPVTMAERRAAATRALARANGDRDPRLDGRYE